MYTVDEKVCVVCGSKATHGVMDMKWVGVDTGYPLFENHGVPRYGCEKHHQKSVIINKEEFLGYRNDSE